VQRTDSRSRAPATSDLQVLARADPLAANHGFTARELNIIRRLIAIHRDTITEAWVSIVEINEPRIRDAKVTSDAIIAYLVNGRVLVCGLYVLASVGSDT
jgi:hypothetical protein